MLRAKARHISIGEHSDAGEHGTADQSGVHVLCGVIYRLIPPQTEELCIIPQYEAVTVSVVDKAAKPYSPVAKCSY